MKSLFLRLFLTALVCSAWIPTSADAYYYHGNYYRYRYGGRYYRYHYHNHYYRHRTWVVGVNGRPAYWRYY